MKTTRIPNSALRITKQCALQLMAIVSLAGLALAQGDQGDLVKITKERIPMDMRLLTLCDGPEAVLGPHVAAEVDVYANPTVIGYRTKNPDSFAYPEGSKFVKKKYPRVGAKTPDIATFMVKTANTGKVTDWEFGMVRLSDGKPVTPRGGVSCADCHQRYKARGYISRQSENALQEYLGSLKHGEKADAGRFAAIAEPEALAGHTGDKSNPSHLAKLTPAEVGFRDQLSDAVLEGSFTLDGANNKQNLHHQSYAISRVKKVGEGRWMFDIRLQGGGLDVTVPLALKVQWAGDTPVIMLTDLPIPGVGTYTARVAIHRGHYAGTWGGKSPNGKDHSGKIFGRIHKEPAEAGSVVIADAAQLDHHLAEVVTLRGELSDKRQKVPAVLGVMVIGEYPRDLVGKKVEVTGRLKRYTIGPDDFGISLAPGTYYDISASGDGEPLTIRAIKE